MRLPPVQNSRGHLETTPKRLRVMGRYVTVNTLSLLMFCSQCKDMRTVSAKLRGTIWRKRLVMSSRVLSCKGAHAHKGGRTAYANSQSDDDDGVVKMRSPSSTSRHHRACRPRHTKSDCIQVGLLPGSLSCLDVLLSETSAAAPPFSS